MADFVSIARLLTVGRPAAIPVAVENGRTLDFGTFTDNVAAWHGAFARSEARRIVLYFDDSATFAAALFGAWHAGKCVYLPSDALPGTISRLRGLVDAFAGDIDVPSRIEPAEPVPVQWRPLDTDSASLVIFTSGSTGEPVAITKRLSQLDAELSALHRQFAEPFTAATVYGTVSHQHIYGLLFLVLLPLALGRPFAARRLAYPEDMVAALRQASSVLISSPAHLKRLPAHLDWSATQQALGAVFSSGGPLPDTALPDCRRLLGRAPIEVYGSSETGGIAWRQRHDDDATAWRPLPGVDIRIEGQQLLVRSAHLEADGWHVTQDTVEAAVTDEQAAFTLLGRADRIVKIEEKRISLDAIERILNATGLIEVARAVVLPGPRMLLGIVGLPSEAGWHCLREEGKATLNARLREALVGQVEACALPRRWRYTWAMPTNSQGKIVTADLLPLFDPRRPTARLVSRTADAAELELLVAADAPFFEGHFPQAPILPGVTQLEWAIRLGRELFPLPEAFLRLEALKFQQVIRPGQMVSLDLTFQAEKGSLSFKLRSSAGAHSSGRVMFGAVA